MATIRDVAKDANVSITSVSRYFNNKDLLSQEAISAIEKSVKKYNYKPNSIGRSLRTARTGKILVLLPTIENPMYLRILTAIENECYHCGYTALTCDTHRDPYKERHLLSMLENHFADGAILFSSSLDANELEVFAKKYPAVLCCEQRSDVNISSVSIDDCKAAFEAVEHLIFMGHKRIAIASGNNGYGSTALREQGYCQALNKHGIDVNPSYIIRGNYGYNSGMNAAQRVMSLAEPPTAMVCISDAVAIGALKYCTERQLKISVVGFDNTSLSGMYMPGITSVAQPRTLMGQTATRMLLAKIGNSKLENQKQLLPHQLVVRSSTTQN